MDASIFSLELEQYQWLLSLYALGGAAVYAIVVKRLALLVPAIKQTYGLNKAVADKQVQKNHYPAIQRRSMFWGFLSYLSIFVFILPFCLTGESQSVWTILLDIFVILMFYDFFYYLTHRFLFHDGPLGGPLQSIHAVHHRQKNPCRMDSNFLHPLETCIGVGLYGASIAATAAFMGDFHLITIIVTMIAFTEINQHNHDRMDYGRFPFKYIKYTSDMHHVHHARFTAGNYATITLLYDWLFGTYDTGEGYKNRKQLFGKQAQSTVTES